MTQLNQLIERLCDANIDLIVGGFAGTLHGSTLVTRDFRAKEALARPKDLLAAQELRAILEQKK